MEEAPQEIEQAESIGFDALRQLQGFRLRALPSVAIIAGTAMQICGENVFRQALYVWPDDASYLVSLRPTSHSLVGFPTSGVQVYPCVIHAAVYPMLCQGIWWANSNVGCTLTIWELEQLA